MKDLIMKLRSYQYGRSIVLDAANALEAQAKRIAELEAALKPFAQKRLSTELTGVTSEYMTPLLAQMEEIKKMEESDNNIRAARKVLGEE